MAKYVILQFDNDSDADTFLEDARNYPGECLLTPVQENDVPFIVRGVWRKPTKFCECKGDMRRSGFRRGQKYGWWVHSKCGKPAPTWGRGDHWFLALGKNLLPVSNDAPEYRGDGVFVRSFKTCPHCDTTLIAEVGHAQAIVWCPNCQKHI